MGIIANRTQILSAIGWYFESKNLALRNLQRARTPLSVQDRIDLRINYSQYFVSLGSATELLLEQDEKVSTISFKQLLSTCLSNKQYPDGAANYDYLRELRNSIVHRGLDISGAAHIATDIPLLLAPETTSDRKGKKIHNAFGTYVIELIALSEHSIGPAIAKYLGAIGALAYDTSDNQSFSDMEVAIKDSIAMPDVVKALALKAINDIDFQKMHKELHEALVKKVLNALRPQPVLEATEVGGLIS